MRRLLAVVLLFAASHADASRFRAPVVRSAVAPVPLTVPSASLLLAPSLLPTLNAADAPLLIDPVAASELTPGQLELIEKKSAHGVERAEKFLETAPLKRGGYLLGINGNGRHQEFAKATGLTPFGESYVELFGRAHPVRTPEFLENLTRSGEEVVFLVPPKALTHEDAKVTKEELEWFFDNPERMKSVRFVFGAYDLSDIRRDLPISDDRHRVEQKNRHSKGYAYEEVDPEALVLEFENEIWKAPMVRERASRRMLYFQTPKGTYIIRRIIRGYFLEFFPEGESVRREAFVSKRTQPGLFGRVESLN